MSHRHAPVIRAIVLRAFCAQAVAVWLAPAAFAASPQGEPSAAVASSQPPASGGETPASQPAEAPAHGQPASSSEGHQAAAGEGGEGEGGAGEHGESPWALVARIFNFAILAGGLFYLLRSPLAGFLEQRGAAVRSELQKAADLKKEAGAQIEQIEARMAALPGEIEALTRRGAEEIKTEEARIQAQAESERKRLLDQARREIESQLRIAERELKKRAGELAVAVATERVKRTITEGDHARLVDRYVSQVRH